MLASFFIFWEKGDCGFGLCDVASLMMNCIDSIRRIVKKSLYSHALPFSILNGLPFSLVVMCVKERKKGKFSHLPWSNKVFFLSERGRGGRAEAAGKMILAER